MKTLKPILIVAFVALTLVSLGTTNNASKTARKAIKLDIEQAINDPGLVEAMHLQLDPNMFNTFQLVYTVDVVYRNYTVSITGTYNQWIMFFSPGGTGLKQYKHTENIR